MILAKCIAIVLAGLGVGAEDAWVQVPKPEKAISNLEQDDPSIWVVFSKELKGERVLIRFPKDPSYQSSDGQFTAWAKDDEGREYFFSAQKRGSAPNESEKLGSASREKRIESGKYLYILRVYDPSDEPLQFNQFVNSFHIERESDFQRG